MAVRRFKPLSRAEKVTRDVSPAKSIGNVAAIDFGTSSCSLAFSTSNDPEKVVNFPFGLDYECRELTAILFSKPNGGKVKVESFGKSAQAQYSCLSNTEVENYTYFECFKMELRRTKVVLKTLIKDSQGHHYYLVEVIAYVLKHLKDIFHKYLETAPFRASTGRPLCCTDFDWIITVPAIWSCASKQMMKKAAQKAGLCSNKVEGINSLTPPEQAIDMTCDNTKPVRIVLEPECAGIFCQNMAHDMKASYSDDPGSQDIDKYMVVDIGGGTVDISVHQVGSEGKIDSVTPPIGNEFGGTKINEKFANLLSCIVQDEEFKSFKRRKPAAKSALSDMIYSKFEKEKKRFGDEGYNASSKSKILLPLNIKFLKFYNEDKIESGIAALGDARMMFSEDGDAIAIEYSYLIEFVQEILDGIWKCTKDAIRKAKSQIDTIYLVGGFGGSRLIFEMLKENFATSFPRLKPPCFVVPLKHDLAVSEGAVLYARNPSKIRSRVSDAHYGICMAIPFNPFKHDEDYAYNDEDGIKYCGPIFLYFVSKGQVVYDNEVFKVTACPHSSQQKTVSLEFCSTTRDDVQYIYDKTKQLNVELVGSIKVIIPESSMQNFPRKKREIKVEMIFSDTEIKAKGTYLPTGAEADIELDFLSNV